LISAHHLHTYIKIIVRDVTGKEAATLQQQQQRRRRRVGCVS